MSSKLFLLFVLAVINLTSAAEITLKLQLEDSQLSNLDPTSDVVLNAILDLATEKLNEKCGASESQENFDQTTAEYSENVLGEMSITEVEISEENGDEAPLAPTPIYLGNDELKPTAFARPMPDGAVVRISQAGNAVGPGNGLQLLDGIDRIRQVDNREDVLHIVDNTHTPPQTQLVDNTLRLLAIKNSVDDLTSRVFPNLRVIQHGLDDHR